eukprot:8608034-Lingulodinium_polyedra.AAC.1
MEEHETPLTRQVLFAARALVKKSSSRADACSDAPRVGEGRSCACDQLSRVTAGLDLVEVGSLPWVALEGNRQ